MGDADVVEVEDSSEEVVGPRACIPRVRPSVRACSTRHARAPYAHASRLEKAVPNVLALSLISASTACCSVAVAGARSRRCTAKPRFCAVVTLHAVLVEEVHVGAAAIASAGSVVSAHTVLVVSISIGRCTFRPGSRYVLPLNRGQNEPGAGRRCIAVDEKAPG